MVVKIIKTAKLNTLNGCMMSESCLTKAILPEGETRPVGRRRACADAVCSWWLHTLLFRRPEHCRAYSRRCIKAAERTPVQSPDPGAAIWVQALWGRASLALPAGSPCPSSSPPSSHPCL